MGKLLTRRPSEERSTILYVDDSYDDAFLFARSLKKVAPASECRHVTTLHDAISYLMGEGPYEDRNLYPLPVFVIAESMLPDGTGPELANWATSRPNFTALRFCIFTDLPKRLRQLLPRAARYFEMPSLLADWPRAIKQMLEWPSGADWQPAT